MHAEISHFPAFEAAARERDNDYAAALQGLAEELLGALRTDPLRSVRTPAWRPGQSQAIEVVAEELASIESDGTFAELMLIVSGAANGDNVQRRAMDWLNKLADKHADTHASVLVGGY